MISKVTEGEDDDEEEDNNGNGEWVAWRIAGDEVDLVVLLSDCCCCCICWAVKSAW